MKINTTMRDIIESIEVLDEASGVGIIKVPPNLIKQINRYVGSVVLTLGYKAYKKINEYDQEDAQRLYNFLKKFQQRYNASILSDSDLKHYSNSSNELNLDLNAIYDSLPENIKRNPKTKELIQNASMKLNLSSQETENLGSSSVSGNHNSVNITVPENYHFDGLDASDISQEMLKPMNTVEHELQHSIQQLVLGKLNRKDSQTEILSDYGETRGNDAYYASGIEYGPQVKDLINEINQWMESNEKSLTGNKKDDVSTAIKSVMSSTYKSKIINALRNYKRDKRANKALKLIYMHCSKYYDEHIKNDIQVDDEFDASEKSISQNINSSERSLQYPIAGETVLGDLWLSYYQHFNSKPRGLGTFDNLEGVRFERPDAKVEIQSENSGDLHISVFTGDRSTSFVFTVPEKYTKLLVKDIMYFSDLRSIKMLRDKLENVSIPDVDLIKTEKSLLRLNDSAETFNDNPDKSINLYYDPDEDGIYITLKGARYDLIIQNNGKEYLALFGNETSKIKQKDFEELMEQLFNFYYDEQFNSKTLNRILKRLTANNYTNKNDMEKEIEYQMELENEAQGVTESSMRSWVDVIQAAEIEGNEELTEMPQKFDVFKGQDPNDAIEQTSNLSDMNNMDVVANHGNYTVMKHKDGSGYIAYDDSGKAIATVNGSIIGKVFHEDSIVSNVKGVVYQIYMDILKSGYSILSDKLHSESAINFWKKIITNHQVYIVGDGQVLGKAVPEKFDKYWNEDEYSPSAELQFLLVK